MNMNNEKDKTEELMENLQQPVVDVSAHRREFRLTLLNTKRSAVFGIALLILPLLFLSGVVLKHYLHIDFGIFTSVYVWIGQADKKFGDKSVINWIVRGLLLFGPLVAIGINLLSIIHIRYERAQKEILMSIKLKWLNWLIIIFCSLIFFIFFMYLIVENAY